MSVIRTLLLLLLIVPVIVRAQLFPFSDATGLQLLYSPTGPTLDSIATHLLAHDIERVTGKRPRVITDVRAVTGHVIVIGAVNTPLVQQYLGKADATRQQLADKWECYAWKVVNNPHHKLAKALVITGSDARGTAYGVFALSEKLGVSPWNWWADVPVQRKAKVTLTLRYVVSQPPAVKYRGIFINDEDWGLQPWAAKTFEPETGDIGPKTYAKVFELLLRLKANLIWPAMHPSTKPFFHYPENKKVAAAYGIVIGTSHAEPMLRNNVGEWDEKTMGPFNYITNKDKVYNYWEQRVRETVNNDAMYTMGMRGVHDSGMEGVKDAKEAAPLLEQIIHDQRDLLNKYTVTDTVGTPQVFTAYKEVLDIYDNGLRLPNDITVVWPDDNYGYIQRLNNRQEQIRAGGAGVYYHASYWGRPHDYLWLPSANPALMREEMYKAYQTGANQLWVVNVGDIKPLEYTIQLFMDMANKPGAFSEGIAVKKHLTTWVKTIFGNDHAGAIATVLQQYNALAFERKPEFMGWSRTEPTTPTTHTEYNHFYYGDEAQRRIDAYTALQAAVRQLRTRLTKEQQDAFYQLVYYPVMGAAWLNKKFLYQDKAVYYARQHRLSAADYAKQANAVYDSIVQETAYYNKVLAGGRWNYMMSMSPRDLPVFKQPAITLPAIDKAGGWGVAPEGYVSKDSSLIAAAGVLTLPVNSSPNKQAYFIDVFLKDTINLTWTATASDPRMQLSQYKGVLTPGWGNNQQRIWVTLHPEQTSGYVVFKGGNKTIKVLAPVKKTPRNPATAAGDYVEHNGYVNLYAGRYGAVTNRQPFRWVPVAGLGYTGAALQALPLHTVAAPVTANPDSITTHNSFVAYSFVTYTDAAPNVTVFTLPTHPLNNAYEMRYGVAVDNGPVQVVNFKTVGRSEEWKQHVLSNRATRTIKLPMMKAGRHQLQIYCIDPGVVLDEIRIDLGGLKAAYSVLPPTVPQQ